MNKEALLKDIATKKEEIAAIKAELSKEVQANFHSLAKEIFEEYPEVKDFGWTQYTPYFNDGDPCTFWCNSSHFHINGKDGYDEQAWGYVGECDEESLNIHQGAEERIGWGENEKPNPDYNPKNKEIVETIRAFLNAFDSDDYEDLFGDHCSVLVTSDKIITEHLEHD